MGFECLPALGKRFCLFPASIGQRDIELPSVLLGARAHDKAFTLELRQHFGQRCGADRLRVLEVALLERAACKAELDEHMLLAAPAATVHMHEVTEVAEVLHDAVLDCRF